MKQKLNWKKKVIRAIVIGTCLFGGSISFSQSVNAEKKDYVKDLKVKKSVTVQVGQKLKVKPIITGTKKADKKITIKSKNKKIAKVNYNAKKKIITITGVKKGTTTIYVKTKEKNRKGKKIEKRIKVKVIKANKKVETTTESTTEATTENKTEEKVYDASGDGWYLLDGTLYLSKIYYDIIEIDDTYYVDYETYWDEYHERITNIVIDADLNYKGDVQKLLDSFEEESTKKNSLMEESILFSQLDRVQSITIKKLAFNQMIDASYMFSNNEKLTHIDISGLDMSGIKNISYMFANNIALSSIDLKNIDTSNVKSVAGMFQGCINLSSVSLSTWNTSNIKDFSHMFENCKSLASVDLSGWSIVDADVSAMFDNCDALSNVELTNVSLQNTIAVNSMFNENNSITSYEFAEGWNIYTEKNKCIFPIGDNCYNAIPTFGISENSSLIVEYVYYKKTMPTWYKESVEYVQSIGEFDKIFSSSDMDIYISLTQEEDAEPPALTDVVESLCDALSEINPETEEETGLLNNLLKKLSMLKKVKDREFNDEDLKELLALSFEELEDLIAEE